MSSLVFLVEQNARGLYFLIGAAMLYFVWRWLRQRYEYRATHFELERDLARYRQANALTMLALLIELALVVLGIERVVAPTIRPEVDAASQRTVVTDGDFKTPTPVLSNAPPIDDSNVQIGEQDIKPVLATPTLTPTPVGTLLPNPPPIYDCASPNATLQIPANGMRVFEPLVVTGSAFIDNFGFYRIELKGPGTFDNFQVYQEQVSPVKTMGELGQFNPAPYAAQPGWYEFRLMVFDISTTLKASCQVNIYISEPVPTPTLIPPPTQTG